VTKPEKKCDKSVENVAKAEKMKPREECDKSGENVTKAEKMTTRQELAS